VIYLNVKRKRFVFMIEKNVNIYLGLEEVFSACNTDFIDIDFGESGQLAQSGILF